MVGITSYGAYVPWLRLERKAILRQNAWYAPATAMVAQGERSLCNWDEDSLTMSVAAARDCLAGKDKNQVGGCYLASTTLPFADRQNAGILATAMNLNENIVTADFTSSLKAGTSALVTALGVIRGGSQKSMLVVASDSREARPASTHEMLFGDGAAAVLVGTEGVLAEFEDAYSLSYDFIDHYRGFGKIFDYNWEERWVRDQGYSKILMEAISGFLKKTGLTVERVDKLIFPCPFKAEHAKIAKRLGFLPEKVVDSLHAVCGETGTAHPLLMLASALDQTQPGQRIVLAGFGQGADVLSFVVTDQIRVRGSRHGLTGTLSIKNTLDHYPKFLFFRDLVPKDTGMRSEAPNQTALTVLWRKRKMILGLVGGRCRECGTPQFPKTDICVRPDCNRVSTQEDHPFADLPARVMTYTGDMLSACPDPPAIYGMIQFEGGGRFMADFTDCRLKDIQVGMPVRLSFRKRYHDSNRGFTGYFWKAVPQV